MDIDLTPGTYVVAVSGGVDSVVLLDLLQRKAAAAAPAPWRLTVAHFDHGIRPDAAEDRQLVQALARAYGLPFVYDEGRLGPGTSEAQARHARYAFLRRVLQATDARAIITAHHQDDLLETAILNLIRGTGRRGLTALASRSGLTRPLLSTPKQQLIAYAQERRLTWREDSTNQDQTYLRNYVRQQLLPRFDGPARERLWSIISKLQTLNQQLDGLLIDQLHLQSVTGTIDRRWFNQLSHDLAREIMATWLRAHDESAYNRQTLEHLVVEAKVARSGKTFSLPGSHSLNISSDRLALNPTER